MEETKVKGVIKDNAAFNALFEQRNKYTPEPHDFHDVLADQRLEYLKKTIQESMDRYNLTEDEISNLGRIRDEMAALSEASWSAGTITAQTEAYLDKYQHKNLRLQEIESQ